MMALSDEQATRLRMVNELITNDPQAARALAGRWGEMIREETQARAAAHAGRYPQATLDDMVRPGGAGLTPQKKPRQAERAWLQESLTERTARILAGQAAQSSGTPPQPRNCGCGTKLRQLWRNAKRKPRLADNQSTASPRAQTDGPPRETLIPGRTRGHHHDRPGRYRPRGGRENCAGRLHGSECRGAQHRPVGRRADHDQAGMARRV